jgi:hypothetical protein
VNIKNENQIKKGFGRFIADVPTHEAYDKLHTDGYTSEIFLIRCSFFKFDENTTNLATSGVFN